MFTRRSSVLTVGLLLTVLLVVLAALYLSAKADRLLTTGEPGVATAWQILLRVPVVELGQFVSAVAASLAFLWIILACFQQNTQLRLQREELILQRNELALQREETKRLAEGARQQVEVLRHTARIARREVFMRFLDLYERKLVHEASLISSMTATDPAASERHQNAWREYEAGDRNALFDNLIRQLVRGGHREFLRLVDQVAGGRAFLERFSATVSEVLNEAASVDDQMLTLCRNSQWAYLSELLDKARNGSAQPQ